MLKMKQTSPLSGMYRRHRSLATELFRDVLLSQEGPISALQLVSSFVDGGRAVPFCKIDPSSYSDAADFRQDYLASELMSKYPGWDTGLDLEAEALRKFAEAEKSCSETNTCLSRSYGVPAVGITAASYLFTAQRKIARVLGPFSWDQAEQFFGFGPGASFALKRKCGDSYHKFGCIPEVTKGCAMLAYTAIRRVPGWFNHLSAISGGSTAKDILSIVPGNRITTVPKNAKTDRVIAIEPLMNMFIQKGIGGLIRRKLLKVGINLNDQVPNQKGAMLGSRDGSLATIDLSMASDTVALELVRQLLPPDWFLAIETARSPCGVLPSGEMIQYQKVSSMGNGFTFELESLIFWALCSSVASLHNLDKGRQLLVYGDDIIVPTDMYDTVVELLSYCGFTVNEKKSFSTGPFRESCGKHYFNGADVTPFYIREDVESPEQLILFLNNLRRFAGRVYPYGLDARYLDVYKKYVGYLPPWFRKPRIPDGYGDGALFGDFSEVCPPRAPYGLEGWKYRCAAMSSSTSVPEDYPILLKSLYGLEVSNGHLDSPTSIPAGGKTKWRWINSIASQWEDKGEWL